jgi:hypothetical protein
MESHSIPIKNESLTAVEPSAECSKQENLPEIAAQRTQLARKGSF